MENALMVGRLKRSITERKKAEKENQRLRNCLSSIIDAIPSVLIGVDAKQRVTQWNKQAEQATGVAAATAVGLPLSVVFPEVMEKIGCMDKAIHDGKIIHKRKMPRYEQDATYYEDLTVTPLVSHGVQGAVIRLNDVTDIVRLEEMIIQCEKMLCVGGLAAGMAHEINNPLAGILQNVSLLKKRLTGDLPANRQAAEAAGTTMAAMEGYLKRRNLFAVLGDIRDSGQRAATIVKNMLRFARKSDRVIVDHDLGMLLDQTLDFVRTDYDTKKRYDFKQIRIIREYEAQAVVPCESSELQQVFFNILKNGAEAMAESAGRQASPTFILRVKACNGWGQVEIEDNGPGMDEATRERIFEPFFTTKPVGRGTGLGLSVSHFIVTERHDGEMGAFAATGGGTCFVIRLPKNRARRASHRETGTD